MTDPSEAATRGARGHEAEGAAAAWLEGQGFRVLARNHRTKRGEVDLVCADGDTVCFVEVRSRATELFGTPAETITREKARRVASAAEDWFQLNGADERPIRFDVVSVTLTDGQPSFELIRAAFDSDGDTRLW
ncbi:MAG: YraN family protein [Anaeromyxobacteraceae bacterium]